MIPAFKITFVPKTSFYNQLSISYLKSSFASNRFTNSVVFFFYSIKVLHFNLLLYIKIYLS